MGLFSSQPQDEYAKRVNDYATEFRALQAADADRLRRMATYRQEIEAARDRSHLVQSPTNTGSDMARKARYSASGKQWAALGGTTRAG